MQSRLQKDVCRMVFLCVILALGLVPVAFPTAVKGEEAKFPSKPIVVIVPQTPGGLTDLVSRIFVESLSRELKVPVILKNMVGARGMLGATAFLNSKPDGYTLFSTAPTIVILSVLFSKTPPFDPRKDLLPVGYIGDASIAVSVPKTSPFKSVHDLFQFAKSNPGNLKAGITTVGGESHTMMMALIRDTKTEVKVVPYAALTTLIPALLGGHVDWMTSTFPAILPYARSGDARILLLTRKESEFPNVPIGPDVGLTNFSINTWLGIFGLPRTPKVAYDRLVAAMKTVLEDPEVGKKIDNTGLNVAYKNPREFSNLIAHNWEIYSPIIKGMGITLD